MRIGSLRYCIRAVFSSVIYLFVPLFLPSICVFRWCVVSPTICNLKWTRDCILPEMRYLLLIWCAVGKCAGDLSLFRGEWVSEFVFIRADLWKICRFAIKCLPIRLLMHTHTHSLTFRAKMRKEYFKCLNMARRKSYGKYLLTDHQSIALHAHTYRIASHRLV